MESVYDTVTTEAPMPIDAVYSILEQENASSNSKSYSLIPVGENLEIDPVYHILDIEEPQLYSNVN